MRASRWRSADFAITLGLLALFVWVVLQARLWPFRTALFPVLTAAVVIGLAVLKLALDLRGSRSRAAPTRAAKTQELVEEEAATEAELESVFETAPRNVWVSALAWMGAFFVLLWLFGVLVTVPLFAFLYLLVVSREHLVLAGAYAVVSWVFVFGLFDRVLHIPLPTGTLLGALGL